MVEIHGQCDPSFAGVRDEFERNFTDRGDVGASVCIYVAGEEVVNLWGGTADSEVQTPWQEDTITVVMSATKGATALCAHILADRGELDFDAPVADYWPEFAAKGKETIPVRMLLNHQAGLSALRKPIPEGSFYDWEYMVNALADEEPFWEPGSRIGYHAATFGWLVGEVIRRVSGQSLGTFFREEVAEPLGLDFWIGLPESELGRVTPLRPDPAETLHAELLEDANANSVEWLAVMNRGGHEIAGSWNTPTSWRAELGASGGITNAQSLAYLYTPLALDGTVNGIRLVAPETILRMNAVQSAVAAEMTNGMSVRFTLGFHKVAWDNGLPEPAFGHVGAGGSIGFADPDARMAFGYVMNQMNTSPRWEALAKASYQALGYREGEFGLWIR